MSLHPVALPQEGPSPGSLGLISLASALSYRDRRHAGEQLASALAPYRGQGVLVLGLAPGGVSIAAEIATALGAELDAIVVQRITAEGRAIGAVAANGPPFLDHALIESLDVDDRDVDRAMRDAADEAAQREISIRGLRPRAHVRSRDVIVVDEAILTGATMRAAIEACRAAGARRIVLAAPVGTEHACKALRREGHAVACPLQPHRPFAIAAHYERLEAIEDAEAAKIVRAARSPGLHSVRPNAQPRVVETTV